MKKNIVLIKEIEDMQDLILGAWIGEFGLGRDFLFKKIQDKKNWRWQELVITNMFYYSRKLFFKGEEFYIAVDLEKCEEWERFDIFVNQLEEFLNENSLC